MLQKSFTLVILFFMFVSNLNAMESSVEEEKKTLTSPLLQTLNKESILNPWNSEAFMKESYEIVSWIRSVFPKYHHTKNPYNLDPFLAMFAHDVFKFFPVPRNMSFRTLYAGRPH